MLTLKQDCKGDAIAAWKRLTQAFRRHGDAKAYEPPPEVQDSELAKRQEDDELPDLPGRAFKLSPSQQEKRSHTTF